MFCASVNREMLSEMYETNEQTYGVRRVTFDDGLFPIDALGIERRSPRRVLVGVSLPYDRAGELLGDVDA